MNKEEMLNKYQELLREYQEVEISRRKSVEAEKKLRNQKDIAEQKIEFEEAKERFEPDDTLSTEDIVKKARLRQESLNKIEEERLNAEKNVKKLESKKEEIRKSAEEYYNSSLQSKLEELNTIKAIKEKEIEIRRKKIEEWSHKENRTTEDYMKLGNELKDSMQDLRKIEDDIDKETERLNKYGKQEKMGMEVAYKSFINGANRIDEGKFSEINNRQNESNENEKFKNIEASGKALSESIRKMKASMEEQPAKIEQPIIAKQEVAEEREATIKFNEKEQNSLNNTSKVRKEETLKDTKQQEKKEFKKIDLNDKNKGEVIENNNSVRILYSAKTDKYIITNVNNGEQKIVSRKNIEKIDRNLLEGKIGKDLSNVDINILQLLLEYDQEYKTTKSSEYVQMLSSLGKNKKERQQEMKENEINIEYNLRGLYGKHEVELDEYETNFSKEERRELLEIANNAKDKGIAKVKKGFKVSLLELGEKISSRILKAKLPTTKKILSLPQTKKQKLREEAKQQEYDKLVNKEYMQSLDEKFEKELKKEKNKQAFVEKVKVASPYKKETKITKKAKQEDREER